MKQSQKLFLLLGMTLLAGGLLFLFTQLSGENKSGGAFKSDNPHFTRISKRIDEMAKTEWNVANYRAIKSEIDQAYQATPKPLINLKEKEALKRLLTSSYFELVAKAAERFCRSQPIQSTGAGALLDEFRTEFPSNFQPERAGKLKNSLQLFQSASNISGSVQGYVTNKAFFVGTTSSYQSRINSIKGDALISSNGSIMGAMRKADGDLTDHQRLGSSMELLKDDGYRDCEYAFSGNANYRRFTYYYNLCKRAAASQIK